MTHATAAHPGAPERRIAGDGYPYAQSDFEKWYADSWQERWARAGRMPTTETPPDGLALGQVGLPLVQRALDEVLPHFPAPEARRAAGQRAAVEVGWTFDHEGFARTHAPGYAEAADLRKFPGLRRLILEAMGELHGNRDLEPRINVSCLLYSSGHGIAFHCDRPYCYEQDVYGCILTNTSDSALEFHQFDYHGSLKQHYAIKELPGVCFAQRGPARFEWKHGVPALTQGERLSVTWRWFLPEVRCKGSAFPSTPELRYSEGEQHRPRGSRHVEDGAGASGAWWRCNASSGHLLESNPAPWQKFKDPASGDLYWWKADADWFWEKTGRGGL